ncbi:MAG: hypothetical protein ACHQLQ_08325 [Candidatus Acidiferrales bacterium]
MRSTLLGLGVIVFTSALFAQDLCAQTTYQLKPTPKTVAWGYYDAKTPPVLRVSRDDAYMLSSVAADLHITELVDGNKGVHMMIPKSIFVSSSK